MSTLQQLIQMGFSPILSQAAIKKLNTEDISSLVDWVSQHCDQQQKWTQWLQQQKNQPSNLNNASQGGKIDGLVNQQMVSILMSKGNSKNVSQKALLLTGNVSVQYAMQWISQHNYDVDFEQQLTLQGTNFEQKSNLTPQQAKQKLKQLTDKARQIKRKKQQQQQRQRQKNRLRFGKQMTQAKRIADQQALKRKIQLDKIQKKKDQQYKAQLVEQMRRQRQQKLGRTYVPTENQSSKVNKQIKLSKLQQVQIQCQQVQVGMHAYPDRARVFFQTANIYVSNIIKNNGQQRTRKINQSNKAFQERIASCFAGVETLQVIGFQDQNGFLVMNNYDLQQLSQISEILQRYLNQYY